MAGLLNLGLNTFNVTHTLSKTTIVFLKNDPSFEAEQMVICKKKKIKICV
jgi:hypothetical protein